MVSSTRRASPSRGGRRFLALWFPFLPLDRLRLAAPWTWARPDDAPDAPTAIVEKQRGGIRLQVLDADALALGLAPGLTLSDARASVPDLRVFDHDPHADQDWLERLCDGCRRYTPMVAIDPPDGLMLDITGCAHLFGGEATMAEAVAGRLSHFGLRLRHALGGTPEAAHALARFQAAPAPDEAAALRRLPVAALELEVESETALRRAGLRTVGEVAARPMASLAARFGAGAVDAVQRLLGEAARPLDPKYREPALILERRFADPVGSTAYALKVLEDLLVDAARLLAEREQGGRRFAATFFRSDGLAFPLRVETGLPARDPQLVLRLFEERIGSLTDPIDPGFGFDLIRLAIPATQSLRPGQLALEGEAEGTEEQVAPLVDRLATRAGRRRVMRLIPQDSHIPEQAQLALPAVEVREPGGWDMPEAGEPPLRPLHMFDPPQRIEVVAEVPDGPPHRFRWRRTLHEVNRFEGPERIAPEWWRDAEGRIGEDAGLTRDYFRVEDVRGRRFWIFRDGLYGTERGQPIWYMHGLFA
ncbi:MAG: nucleotidyltransferase [Sphingobium sp.]|nr:MAG: nucleotidyltransferase [Sphingobium sp.]